VPLGALIHAVCVLFNCWCRCRWVPLLLGAGAMAAPDLGPLLVLGSKHEATVRAQTEHRIIGIAAM
jgi:hypothetical protein